MGMQPDVMMTNPIEDEWLRMLGMEVAVYLLLIRTRV